MSDTNEDTGADDPKKDVDGAETDEDILEGARKEYRMCLDADTNRDAALDDLRFLQGGENQWDARAVQIRKADGRPIITVNDLPTFLHQVTNDQRQNTPSIKVHPVDDAADVKTANVVQGMIRHIEYDSNADVAYDRAVNSAAAIGFGYWYLDTEFEREDGNDQKICYRSIRNHLAVRTDPLATEPDGSDMGFAFIESLVAKTDFKREHPKANANNNTVFEGNSDYTGWHTDDSVLVCRYYKIRKTSEEVVTLSNGESGFKSDLVSMDEGVTIIKTRKGERKRVMLYKITAVDVLERTEIKCKWIPVFPVYGDEIDIEGKVTRSGIIRNAKGPCAAYNVMISGATEEVALRTKSPYIGAEGFMEGHEDDWAQANQRAFPALEYKLSSLDGKLAPPPQRQPMADIPHGMLAMAMHAQDNKKKTTGLFDSSIGAKGNATSGVQERAQQQQGDMANMHYNDGLLRTLRHCGRCIVSMIPNYYDTARTVRILGEDGKGGFVKINQPQMQQQGGIEVFLNDVTVGEFDITVTAGPSYTTMRQESAEFFTNAMQAAKDPAIHAIVTYLAMKNQDVPGVETATKMIEAMLPPPAKAVLDEARQNEGGTEAPQMVQLPEGPLPVSQVPQAMAALQQQVMQANEIIEKSKAEKHAAEILKQQNESMKLQLEQRRVVIEEGNAMAERANLEKEAETERIEAIAKAEKERAEAEKAAAENIRAQMERDATPEQPAPSLEEIAQLIVASKQPINGMTITSPSGQTYSVKVH